MRLFSRSSLSLKGEGKGEGDRPIRSSQLLPAWPSEFVFLSEPKGESLRLGRGNRYDLEPLVRF
jgi:hypothetical protein